jgi:hypothetical protein
MIAKLTGLLKELLGGTKPTQFEADAAASESIEPYSQGFLLGNQSFPWGTTTDSLARQISLTPQLSQRTFKTAANREFGLDIVSAELFNFYSTLPVAQQQRFAARPIEQAWYTICSNPKSVEKHRDQAQRMHAMMLTRWGKPTHGDLEAKFDGKQYASTVASYCVWELGGGSVELRLSWYGAPRQETSADGSTHMTAGFIALSWLDLAAAAKPFIGEWQTRQDALNELDGFSVLARAPLSAGASGPMPRYAPDGESPPPITDQDRLHWRVIHAPDRLITSTAIRKLLSPNESVMWRAGDLWGASTLHDTVCFSQDEVVAVEWCHTTPGRGGGYEELKISSLSLMGDAKPLEQCDDVRAMVDAMKQVGRVEYAFSEYADC